MKLAGYIAGHNCPFLYFDHLADILKDCFSDSEIIKGKTYKLLFSHNLSHILLLFLCYIGISMKRTKTTAIITIVIGATAKEELINELKHNKFSILTHESTDIATVKISCVVVR